MILKYFSLLLLLIIFSISCTSPNNEVPIEAPTTTTEEPTTTTEEPTTTTTSQPVETTTTYQPPNEGEEFELILELCGLASNSVQCEQECFYSQPNFEGCVAESVEIRNAEEVASTAMSLPASTTTKPLKHDEHDEHDEPNRPAPGANWHVGVGTNEEEHVHEGMETSDGGFLAIGHTAENEVDFVPNLLIVKTDPFGNELWQAVLGTTNEFDVGYSVAETSDGYLAGGGIYSNGFQKRALIKFSFSGEILWQRIYEHSGIGAVRGIEVLNNGEIIITGYIEGEESGFLFISDGSTGFLSKVSADGDLLWDRRLESPQGTKVKQAVNGGFALATTVWTGTDGPGEEEEAVMNAKVFFTDSDGFIQKSQTYGGDNNVQLFDFDVTNDGGFIFTGHTTGYDSANWDCILGRINSAGEELWIKTFGQPRGYDPNFILDECYGVRQKPDGGFVMTGGTGDHSEEFSSYGHSSGPSDEWKVLLVETDGDGNLESMKVHGPEGGHNAGEYVGLTSDGGFIVFTDTDTQSPPAPNNFGLLKIFP